MKRWFVLGLVLALLCGVIASSAIAADQLRQRDQDQQKLQDKLQDCTCPECGCPDCTCPDCDCPENCCENCAEWQYVMYMLRCMFGR